MSENVKNKSKLVIKSNTNAIADKNGKNIYPCYCCGNTSVMDRFTNIVRSDLYKSMNHHLPICKECVHNLYTELLKNVYCGDEKDTLRRICCMFDIYFNNEIYEASKNINNKNVVSNYLQVLGSPTFNAHRSKTFNNTIWEENGVTPIVSKINNRKDKEEITSEVRDFFGQGFDDSDYKYLKHEYDDWMERCGLQGKSVEELIKRICFIQLQILKNTQAGKSTKDLDATLQNYLNTANLSPKQRATTDTSSDSQSFGELIKKLENERPVAEIDDDLKDVDKIGLYIDVFFKGHLAKMMGLKNGFSRLYEKYIKKYTVKKPEYQDDESNEALFDAIFGQQLNDNIDDYIDNETDNNEDYDAND